MDASFNHSALHLRVVVHIAHMSSTHLIAMDTEQKAGQICQGRDTKIFAIKHQTRAVDEALITILTCDRCSLNVLKANGVITPFVVPIKHALIHERADSRNFRAQAVSTTRVNMIRARIDLDIARTLGCPDTPCYVSKCVVSNPMRTGGIDIGYTLRHNGMLAGNATREEPRR